MFHNVRLLILLLTVAAGVPPAVEPGILPGGLSRGLRRHFRVQSAHSGRQDAALYGSQDGCRYSHNATVNTYGRERVRVRVNLFELRLRLGTYFCTHSLRLVRYPLRFHLIHNAAIVPKTPNMAMLRGAQSQRICSRALSRDWPWRCNSIRCVPFLPSDHA